MSEGVRNLNYNNFDEFLIILRSSHEITSLSFKFDSSGWNKFINFNVLFESYHINFQFKKE